MKRILILTTVAMSALPLLAQDAPNREGLDVPKASPGSPDKLPGEEGGDTESGKGPDERFIRKAGKAGRMEAKIAEMAATRASRKDLKAFAAMLVKDHSAANAELAEIAKSLGLTIPEGSHAGSHEKPRHARPENDPSGRPQLETVPKDPSRESATNHLESLKDKTGMEFDAAFLEVMDQCHKEDIALFEKAEGRVKDPTLKAFIVKTLPVLKAHAAALERLEKKDPSLPDATEGTVEETPVPAPTVPDGNPPRRRVISAQSVNPHRNLAGMEPGGVFDFA